MQLNVSVGFLVLAILGALGCGTSRSASILSAGFPTAQPVPGVYHRVESGQTLWRISRMYGVDLDEIVAANQIPDAGKITKGQLVFIPGASKRNVSRTSATAKTVPAESFVWPVQGKVISHFGSSTNGVLNKGINIQAEEGTLVLASRSGTVQFIHDKVKGFGKTLMIDHGDGFVTVYAHNSEILVSVGQHVRQSNPVARVGTTGRGSDPFLHFEIRKNHKPKNPLFFLPSR
jgi:murein DD-endopeptidase MepM/ murein hydrolase activator NlpD